MTLYKEIVTLPKDSIYEQVEGLSGKDCYDKFGLKRDEALTYTVTFPNNYQADLKMCVCDEDYTTFSEGILYNDKNRQVFLTEPGESIIGEWYLEDLDNNTYMIDVVVE